MTTEQRSGAPRTHTHTYAGAECAYLHHPVDGRQQQQPRTEEVCEKRAFYTVSSYRNFEIILVADVIGLCVAVVKLDR